jgi:hypothetical protein
LVVALALPASADVEFYIGPVAPGTTLELTCPEGQRVESDGIGYGTAVTFYANHQQRKVIAEYVGGQGATPITDASGNVVGLSYVVPSKSRYVYGWVNCQPIPPPTQTVTLVQRNEETFFAYVYFTCPEATPYVVGVQQVTGDLDGDFSTVADQFTPEYVIDAGLQVRPGPVAPGVYVKVTMICSSVPS